jgi:hypothetical protein
MKDPVAPHDSMKDPASPHHSHARGGPLNRGRHHGRTV